jgi:hypothetical protein
MGQGSSGAPGGSWGYVGAGVVVEIVAAVRGLVELLPGGLKGNAPPRLASFAPSLPCQASPLVERLASRP